MTKKCPPPKKKAEGKRDGVISPQNYNLYNFKLKILMLSKRFKSTEVDRKIGYMCPRGLTGPPAVTLTKKLKY